MVPHVRTRQALYRQAWKTPRPRQETIKNGELDENVEQVEEETVEVNEWTGILEDYKTTKASHDCTLFS